MTQTADLLDAIVAATRRTVEVRRERESTESLERRAAASSVLPGRFHAALARAEKTPNVIAECKRRSPSRGVLRADYDAAAIARGYAAAGAAAISVLTEPTFFDGSLADLAAVRAAVDVPLLRKDFVVTEYQLLEARANGADAVLLIVAGLAQDRLKALHAQAAALGLDVLVEVHDETELDRALDAGAGIIGVNNRNLRTLAVDVAVSERIAPRIPSDVVAVCESGLKTSEDLRRFRGFGYRAFLIGERLMTEQDPGAALSRVLMSCS
ncbi:MAG TPA: indole-3-glycerol phosphate synthase TrpC [Vicinamibacterales bacterium]|nr:indole-3-glycerol phosphate synthase TrpC [Vicinamibacterales bacterium]